MEEINQQGVAQTDYYKKRTIALIILVALFCFLLIAIWKGYNRGTDHYQSMSNIFKVDQWPLQGLLRVKMLFYLYIFFDLVLAIFSGWFIGSSLKNKILKALFIFPFLFTLLVYIYFQIFEGGVLASGAGIGMGAVAVFLAEIFSFAFYVLFLVDFVKLRKIYLDKVDKTLFVMLIFHPVIIFLLGSAVINPVIMYAENNAPKTQKQMQNKQVQEKESYDDAKIINVGSNVLLQEQEEDKQISLMYGVKNVDWKFSSKGSIACQITDSYECEKIDIILKDGGKKSIIFKVYNKFIIQHK